MSSYNFEQARSYCEHFLGHTFQNPTHLEEALYAGGPTMIGDRAITDANKRLAQVGDSAIGLVMVSEGYDAGLSKGDTSNLQQRVLCNQHLDRAGRVSGIERYITLNGGTTAVSSKTMATTVEAILGALFKDSGSNLEVVKQGMRAFLLLRGGSQWMTT